MPAKSVVLVTPFWNNKNRSGVGVCAALHGEWLALRGYQVHVISSSQDFKHMKSDKFHYHYVYAKGGGAAYSPSRCDRLALHDILSKVSPQFVLVEAWQTGLSHGAIEVAHGVDIPVGLISHGVSIHPFDSSFKSFFRYLSWLPFRFITLPRLIKKLSALASLDISGRSLRFFDRVLCDNQNVEVFHVPNTAINYKLSKKNGFSQRQPIVLVIGYFSYVKNQMLALRYALDLKNIANAKFLFIGNKSGRYYENCLKFVKDNNMSEYVSFKDDTEINLSEAYSEARVVFVPSVTEAMPVTVLEAMASGTPFIMNSVGSEISGGIRIDIHNRRKTLECLKTLLIDERTWLAHSVACMSEYGENYEVAVVKEKFDRFISFMGVAR